MAGTLSISNFISYVDQAQTWAASHGPITATSATPFSVTTTGPCQFLQGTLATATVITPWASATSLPATFIYAYYWSDQISYIQLVGSATNSQHHVAATVPFVIPGYGSVLAAASTSIITGGSEPAVTALTKIVLGNYSGNTMNWILAVIL